MVHPEALGRGPHRASTRDGKKVANIIPVDHGAIRHRRGAPSKPVSNTSNSISYVGSTAVIIARAGKRGPIPNGGHRTSRLASIAQPDGFRTTDVRASQLTAYLGRTHVEALGGPLRTA
ncbi:hypothetical protein GCM10007874_40740 [Labrys miyagiensis]|uniref:Uncharacterized protein n=1 Tax=Labrys miyagiensis TaxID=346912 RepID=A0ABQ6CS04_9HYPH|nr:hypothetical protein GCM10007874_40740 [Labrys miyagiensis]